MDTNQTDCPETDFQSQYTNYARSFMNTTRNYIGPEKAANVLIRIRNLHPSKDEDPTQDQDSEKTHHLEMIQHGQFLQKGRTKKMKRMKKKSKFQDLREDAGAEGLCPHYPLFDSSVLVNLDCQMRIQGPRWKAKI